mmetsp:Transcript_14448/g.31265  ORF Transcript_14448/g.31265 Transcript_14448/m.31265 type:complete len:238 (-) Transcript_14448:224-937(-)
MHTQITAAGRPHQPMAWSPQSGTQSATVLACGSSPKDRLLATKYPPSRRASALSSSVAPLHAPPMLRLRLQTFECLGNAKCAKTRSGVGRHPNTGKKRPNGRRTSSMATLQRWRPRDPVSRRTFRQANHNAACILPVLSHKCHTPPRPPQLPASEDAVELPSPAHFPHRRTIRARTEQRMKPEQPLKRLPRCQLRQCDCRAGRRAAARLDRRPSSVELGWTAARKFPPVAAQLAGRT